MPGFDRKGPEGNGPMTGRGLGRCKDPETKNDDFNDDNEMRGRGWGRRFGFRGGFGRGRGRGTGRGR